MNKQGKHRLGKRKIRPSPAAAAASSMDEVSNKPGQRGSNSNTEATARSKVSEKAPLYRGEFVQRLQTVEAEELQLIVEWQHHKDMLS